MILWMTNHLQESHDELTEGLAIAEREGIHFWDFMLLCHLTHCSLCQGNIEAAQGYLDQMTFILGTQRKLDIAHYHYLEAGKALCLANPALALKHLDRFDYFAREAGAPFFAQFYYPTGKADVLIELEAYDQAEQYIDTALRYGRKINSIYCEYLCAWLRAVLNFKQNNDEAGIFHLRNYLSISKAHETVNHTWWRSSVMAPLFQKALEADIEIDHVQRLIREHAIAPPVSGHYVKNWPYPLKVYTLGSFSVLVDNQPLSYNHRGQNKPLALLKAIIAFGGRQVREEQLWEALWPDAEGDAAHVAFTTTLHRLRKLIGCEQAIILQGRQISLDPQHCWVDTWCLEALLGQSPTVEISPEADTEKLPHSAQQIFHLYQSHFLDGENAPWVLGIRERLRNRMVRQINTIAGQCQARKRWPSAIAVYERGLVIDPLLESFYLGLMQCFIKMERFADALATYERCRMILNEVLKVGPCSDIESLRRQLRD
jgi:DNA-binding SARP family transcriptional activator